MVQLIILKRLQVLLTLSICLGFGCQNDECVRLCTALSQQLDECQDEWNTNWQYMDASSAFAFEAVCQDNWTQQAADLEWRQRVEAESQCDAVLTEVSAGDIECIDLQVLYFYDPQR